jgi:two-component sensor histidine kinase
MSAVLPAPAHYPAEILGWRRLRIMVLIALAFAAVHTDSPTPFYIWFARTLTVSMFAFIAYGIFERWPRTLPDWVARWFVQIVAVIVAGICGSVFAYVLPAKGDFHAIWYDEPYRNGMLSLIIPCILFSPPVAFAAIMRRRESEAREQAMRFELERSELQRQAADTQLRLLQAQVQPHFLFNTLANIRALVNAGSPRAVQVMDSLIAYLRASVPRLQQAEGTVAQELDLVRAYLELMHMRMPDRLHYSVDADADALQQRCPPMALLTLVENAVRHGIDPGEEGGRIDVSVRLHDGRCIATVADTGVGLRDAGTGGSGLANLRERMKLAFGDAQLRLGSNEPRGTRAVIEYPAQVGSK